MATSRTQPKRTATPCAIDRFGIQRNSTALKTAARLAQRGRRAFEQPRAVVQENTREEPKYERAHRVQNLPKRQPLE